MPWSDKLTVEALKTATPTPRCAWPTSQAGHCSSRRPRPSTAALDLEDGPVVFLREDEPLGYLPEPARIQLGW
jgi:hypothetical protein